MQSTKAPTHSIPITKRRSIMKAFTIASIALVVASCSDNPVVPEEHFEARGVVVRIGDSTIVTVDSNRVTGIIELDSASVARFGIKFILENGTVSTPGHTDAMEHQLSVEVADTTVASVIAVDDHAWTMTLKGHRADTTSLRVHLL